MVKVAVIGVGHLGKQHARLYAELEGVELAGVVDILKPRAEEFALLYKTTAYTDYRDILGKVDAVSLAVPTTEHARLGVELLDHGVDVLVEKPIASTIADARALIEASSQDRKSTRLNSSHGSISYAVFCLKKKNPKNSISRATTH